MEGHFECAGRLGFSFLFKACIAVMFSLVSGIGFSRASVVSSDAFHPLSFLIFFRF